MIAKPPMVAAPVLVAGLGRAGQAALTLLIDAIGPSAITAWDASVGKTMQARAAKWRRRGVRVSLGGDGAGLISAGDSFATIVKSPGIAMDAPLLRAAASQGVEVVDELEIGWRACRTPVIAVTGTNGKSTTCALIASMLRAAGQPAQIVGNTEFGPPLSGARSDAAVVCEVSSFQLEAAPTFLPKVAVFTNLSLEHLPRHGTMEAYGAAKQRMFLKGARACGLAVVNVDDAWGRRIMAAVKEAGGRVVAFGFSPDADVRIIEARWTMRAANTRVLAGDRIIDLPSRLPGRHNALNIAAAVAVGLGTGMAPGIIADGVRDAAAPPGRCQIIDEGQPFDVVVDYAHTPDGIAQFLAAARAAAAARQGSLRTVFGAVGLPDPLKAHGCAEAARRFSDHLILTTGSAPRSCRILRLRELRDAARPIGPVELVLERRQAIRHAIASARPGDIVAILGLGALGYQVLDRLGTYSLLDDREVARSSLRLYAP